MNPAEYAGVATTIPGDASSAWALVAIALALAIAAIEGWDQP